MEVEPRKIDRIETVVFKRTEKAEWEKGLMINEGQMFLDDMGNAVPKVYNFEHRNEIVVTTQWFQTV